MGELTVEERIKQAREEGRQEGEVSAKLNMLIRQGEQMITWMGEVRSSQTSLTQLVTRLDEKYEGLRAEQLDVRGRVRNLEESRATKAELQSVESDLKTQLKGVADTLSNFLIKLAIAGIGGGGAGAASLYAILKVVRVVP